MNRAIWKDNLSEIKKTWPRFLSILLIMLLGVAFFTGIRATSPAMIETARRYFKAHHLPDGQIISTLGLNEDDLQKLQSLDLTLDPIQTIETTLQPLTERVKVYPLTEQGYFFAVEGKLPNKANEIGIDIKYRDKIKIGEQITLENVEIDEENSLENMTPPSLVTTEFTVTGYVDSSLYYSKITRGASNINAFVVVDQSVMQGDFYTEIFYWAKKTEGLPAYSTAYQKAMEDVQATIEKTFEQRPSERLAELVSELETDIKDGADEVASGYQELDDAEKELADAKDELAKGQTTYDQGMSELSIAKEALAQAATQLPNGQAEYDQMAAQIAATEAQLAQAKQELDQNNALYEENLAKFNKEKADALVDLKDAENKLADAREAKADLKEPVYYFNQRKDFDSYDSLFDNANQIKQISTVFPLFFFAIALLVTFTTIKRMVSEQRNYMGTMKQMGYMNITIIQKFIWYAVTATVVGTAVGIEVGYRLFPNIIMTAYSTLFHLENPIILRSSRLIILVSVIALLCALIPSIITPLNLLRAAPATLLRPEPPKSGRQILLEKIPFIWRRLSFNRKMTIRNIVRYKGRNLMTLVGVAGCTMLIVTGYGISDTIAGLVDTQFETLQTYDSVAYLADDMEEADLQALVQKIDAESVVQTVQPFHSENWKTTGELAVQNVSVVVLAEQTSLIELHERLVPEETVDLAKLNGVAISERLAEYEQVTIGDDLILSDDDGETYHLPVSKIVENYIGHYVYLSPAQYEQIVGEQAHNNALMLAYQADAKVDTFEQKLTDNKKVLTLLNLQTVENSVQKTMGSLGVITLVLIISAAALAFVVLYNLTNINVSERLRELSTIKVLGFYNREVSLYIYDEILLITIFGSAIGLLLGTALNYYILKTIQMPNLFFYPLINWQSYVISAVLTLIFASIVMIVMHFKLKKINMVEALKAVE